MKISIEEIESVLSETNLSVAEKQEIIQKLERIVQEEKDNKEPTTKAKKPFIGITTGGNINDAPLYIVQIKDDLNHEEIIPKIIEAVKEFNETKKGRKNPIKTLGEAMEHCKRKLFTSRGISVKTKEAIIIVKTDNNLNLG